MLCLQEVLEVARSAALEAGKYILNNLGQAQKPEFKGERNIVTEVDRKSEEIIKSHLEREFPDFEILGEELGGETKSQYYWLIDPLDGSNNFFHSYPVFCISIALMQAKQPLLGIIYDPSRNELFHTIKGKGAYLNQQKIAVSTTTNLKGSLLATGFYYEFKTQPDTNIEHFVDLLCSSQGIRRSGSAAIDLAYVAAGRLDGFWELGLKPWDTASGWLMVEEAGGKVSKLNGSEFDPFYPEIVSSNGLIHAQIIEVLKRHSSQI